MTSQECSELILAFARTLFVNGQATEQVVSVIHWLGHRLGVRSNLLPRWGELQLRTVSGDATSISYAPADPVAPVAPVRPVMPWTPVSPVAPEVPADPVAPVAPVAPVRPVMP